jgi:hypothetical protein
MPNLSANIPFNDSIFILVSSIDCPTEWNVTQKDAWYKLPCISNLDRVVSLPNKYLLSIAQVAVLEKSRTIVKFNFYPKVVNTRIREKLFHDIESSSHNIKDYTFFKVSNQVKEQRAELQGFLNLETYLGSWKKGIPFTQAGINTLNAFHFFRNVITKPMPSI